MRRDSKILLEKLEQDKFPYQDFSYAFYVNSEWKALESLKRDKRIFGDTNQNISQNSTTRSLSQGNDMLIDALPAAPSPSSTQQEIDLRQFFIRFTEGE